MTYRYTHTHTITTSTYLIRINIYHKDFKTTVGPISKLPLWHSWWNEYKMIAPFEMDPSLNKVYSRSCEYYYYMNTCWAPHLEITQCASQQQLYSTVLSSRADQPRFSRMRQYGQKWSVHEVMFTMTRPVQLCANVIHSVSAGDWFHSSSAERSPSSFFNGCMKRKKFDRIFCLNSTYARQNVAGLCLPVGVASGTIAELAPVSVNLQATREDRDIRIIRILR